MSKRDSPSDDEREYFLGLNRQWIGYEYWVKFRVTAVEASAERPHGLQYSFSLHDANDERILGYNNARPVDAATGPARRSKRPTAWDHTTRRGKSKSVPYTFESPYQLVADFFAEVDEILKKEGVQ
jgi:hypothetical protein